MNSDSIDETPPLVCHSSEFDVTERFIKDQLDEDYIESISIFFNRLKEEELSSLMVERSLERSISLKENIFLPSSEQEKCKACVMDHSLPSIIGTLCGGLGLLGAALTTNSLSCGCATGTTCFLGSCGLTYFWVYSKHQSILNESLEHHEILKSNQNLQHQNLDDKIILYALRNWSLSKHMSYQQLKRARDLDPDQFKLLHNKDCFSEIQNYNWQIIRTIEHSDTDEIIKKLSADALQNKMKDHPIIFVGILQHLRPDNYKNSELIKVVIDFFRKHLLTDSDKKLSDDAIKSILNTLRHANEVCIKKAGSSRSEL